MTLADRSRYKCTPGTLVALIALDVRKLAALDMAFHGERFILGEFGIGVAGSIVLCVLSLSAGFRSGTVWELLLGLALLWIGLNYVPLLVHAIDLARLGAARLEAADEIERPELIRGYTARQLWILLPFAVVIMDLVQRRRRL